MSRSSRISATIAFLGCLLITRFQDDEADHDDNADDEEEVMCDQHSLHSWAAHQAAAVSSVADQLSSTQLGLTTQMGSIQLN